MNKPSITFESWTAVTDDIEVLREHERKRMSGPWRVWEICIARANNWGHAAFRPGELAGLACGVDSPANRDQVRRWLKILGEMCRVDSRHSTQLCVMVNRDIAQRQAGKGSRKHMCFEPAHADMREEPYAPKAMEPTFTPPPWEPEPPEDDPWAEISEPDPPVSASGTPAKTTVRQLLSID